MHKNGQSWTLHALTGHPKSTLMATNRDFVDGFGTESRQVCHTWLIETTLFQARGRANRSHTTQQRRILSSTVGSEPLGKFSTLLSFSTGYQTRWLSRFDPR